LKVHPCPIVVQLTFVRESASSLSNRCTARSGLLNQPHLAGNETMNPQQNQSSYLTRLAACLSSSEHSELLVRSFRCLPPGSVCQLHRLKASFPHLVTLPFLRLDERFLLNPKVYQWPVYLGPSKHFHQKHTRQPYRHPVALVVVISGQVSQSFVVLLLVSFRRQAWLALCLENLAFSVARDFTSFMRN